MLIYLMFDIAFDKKTKLDYIGPRDEVGSGGQGPTGSQGVKG